MTPPPVDLRDRADLGVHDRSTSAANRIAALTLRASLGYQNAAPSAFAHMSDDLHAMYWVIPAHRLYPLVIAAIRTSRDVTGPDGSGPHSSTEASSAAAGLAMLAGRIAYLDFDLVGVADDHQVEAIGLAYRAQDLQIVAAATTQRALIEARSGGHHRARLLIGTANSILSRVGSTRRTRLQHIWQDAVAAEVAVHGGDGVRGIAALRLIGPRMSGKRATETPRWLDFFDRSRLAATIGAAELRVGEPTRAALMLLSCLRSAAPSAAKEWSVVLADLADARRLQLDSMEACHLLSQALDIIDDHEYMTGLRRVAEVRRMLPPTTTTAAILRIDRQLSTWDAVLTGSP